jgi:phosphonate transport system substrate-binding protein
VTNSHAYLEAGLADRNGGVCNLVQGSDVVFSQVSYASQGITVKGHDKGVIAVLNGAVDAAAVFEDARNNVKKDFPNVFNDTKVIYRTQGIPNDTIAVRSDMDAEWKDKISQAFIDIAKDPEGSKLVKDLYAHAGYVKSNDKNFDTVREYQKALGSENK